MSRWAIIPWKPVARVVSVWRSEFIPAVLTRWPRLVLQPPQGTVCVECINHKHSDVLDQNSNHVRFHKRLATNATTRYLVLVKRFIQNRFYVKDYDHAGNEGVGLNNGCCVYMCVRVCVRAILVDRGLFRQWRVDRRQTKSWEDSSEHVKTNHLKK